MKIKIEKNKISDPEKFIRRAGYGRLAPRGGEVSYYQPLQSGMLYPRLHIYIEDLGDVWSFNLHLDQRQPSYKGVAAHSGEYEGEVVEKEVERLKKLLA